MIITIYKEKEGRDRARRRYRGGTSMDRGARNGRERDLLLLLLLLVVISRDLLCRIGLRGERVEVCVRKVEGREGGLTWRDSKLDHSEGIGGSISLHNLQSDPHLLPDVVVFPLSIVDLISEVLGLVQEGIHWLKELFVVRRHGDPHAVCTLDELLQRLGGERGEEWEIRRERERGE
jgi:hypothetical protein